MAQFYFDPNRESNPYALPDAEVFPIGEKDESFAENGEPLPAGWYWWACQPGCLPDSEPQGPFDTEEEAIADARDGMEDEDED